MVKEWTVSRTNHILYLVYYYLFLLTGYSILIIRSLGYEGTFIANFKEVIIYYSLIILLAIISPTIWILKKKIPKRIAIDATTNEMTIKGKKLNLTIHLDELAYDFKRKSFYSDLILYRKYTASRGHIIYSKSISLVAPIISISWKIKTLAEIVTHLDQMKVKKYVSAEESSFLVDLFE